MSRWERLALALVPIMAMLTLALGLTIGARESVRAAEVWASPPARGAQSLAWQVVTIEDERGVREPVALGEVVARVRVDGREATWTGATNADGVAELGLGLSGVKGGDHITVDLRGGAGGLPLAQGDAVCPRSSEDPSQATRSPAVRYARRSGELSLDVAVYGEKLVPGFAT